MRLAALLAALAWTVGVADAAPIYRCGPDGKTYSQVPCDGGTVVEASDPRSAAQRAEAKRIAAAERKAAAEQERERKAQEKAAAKSTALPGNLSVPAASAPASAPKPKKGAKAKQAAERDFIAVSPREKAAGK
jgi:hypothetical protein